MDSGSTQISTRGVVMPRGRPQIMWADDIKKLTGKQMEKRGI